MKRSHTGSVLPSLLLFIWLAIACTGFLYLINYHLEPSESGKVPSSWPTESALTLHDSHDTLVMLLHPKCACSTASISELARITAKVGDAISPKLIFVAEKNQLQELQLTSLWQQARGIPKVQILVDKNGIEAENFGSLTSGQVALYDPEGILLFQGGITASRGHEGDNRGSQSIVELVRTKHSTQQTTPVFGCGLFDKAKGDS